MAINFAPNLSDQQKTGITNLVNSGRAFNETDAKNYAFATGAKDFNQFVGKTGQQVTVPDTFNASDLGQNHNLNLPQPQQSNNDPSSFVGSLDSSIKSFEEMIKNANTITAPIEEERTTLTDKLKSSLEKLKGRSTALAAKEEELGVSKDIKQLQDLTLTIAQKTGEFNKAIAGLEGQGRGITTGIISKQSDALRRQEAAEIGALASVAQALQGNIALSQQTAQRAVDFEFEPIEQEIKNLSLMLDLNQENLTSAEKKRAEKLQFTLQERQRLLDEQKEERKQVLNLAAQAAQQGADNATLTKMVQAKSTEEALQIGGSVLGAEFRNKLQQQKFENDLRMKEFALDTRLKNAQIANIYSEINKRVTDNKPITVPDINIPGLPAETKNRMIITTLLQNPKIGQGTRTNMGNALGVIKALEDLAKANPEGTIKGVNPLRRLLDVKIPWTDIGIPGREIFKKDATVKNEGYIEAINLRVQQWASGASLTKQQTEQVNKITPRVTDTDKNFKTKMNSLANFMLTQTASQLQTEGIDFTPEQVNLFEISDLLKSASPEQIKQLKDQGLIQ